MPPHLRTTKATVSGAACATGSQAGGEALQPNPMEQFVNSLRWRL